MAFYDDIGVRPFINAAGWAYTRYGGTIMPEPVVAAMAEASRHYVHINDLQNRVGDAIAGLTQNQAAYVSCGAASGIVLSVATCIAGTDETLANQLPDSTGMRNQVLMRRCDRGTEADPAIRAGGGRIVDIGDSHGASAEHFSNACNENTAAVLLLGGESWEPAELTSIVQLAHARNVPVLVDGADTLPPKSNLWRYTQDFDVDAFIVSGGKAIRGPQSTGLVLGKRAIIEGCKFHGSPNLRIGRGMKVGKEEFAGIYTAMKLFLDRDLEAQHTHQARQIAYIADALQGIPQMKLNIVGATQLNIELDLSANDVTAESIARTLLATDPSILLGGRSGTLTVRAARFQDGEEQIVATRLRQLLTVLFRSP